MTEATPPSGNTPADTGAKETPAPAASAAPPSPATPPNDAIPKSTPESSPSSKDTTSTPAQGESPAPVESAKPGDWKLPDEWKDKPWALKIKSEADLYKQLDNLNTAVGKKIVVPDLATATEAEREEYFKLTRPEKGAEAYQFGDTIDPVLKTGMSESLLKNGLTAWQANNIIKDYQSAEQKFLAAQYAPEAISETMEKAFGKDWQNVVGATKNSLSVVMSPEDNHLIDNLPNSYISLIYRTFGNVIKAVEKVRSDYGIKESAAHILAGSAPSAPAVDLNSQRAALRGELGKLTSRPHSDAERQAIIQKINDTYKDDPRIVRKA